MRGREDGFIPRQLVITRDHSRIPQRLQLHGAESHDVAPLPGRLDRPAVVALAYKGDGMIGRYAIQHRKTGERSARPAAPSAASDLDSLAPSSTPRLTQRVPRVSLVDRQPQVRPTNPSLFPVHGRRRGPAQQVEPKVRRHTIRHRLPQATAPDRSTGRQTKHA